MTFTVTIDHDEDGVWVVECPSIPGCVSQGATEDEAIENIKDAIAQCLEARAESGMGLDGLILRTAEGKELLTAGIGAFEREITLVRQNPELMELLKQRAEPGPTLTLDEVKESLGLNEPLSDDGPTTN
jgi:predicted RNase H-like HicB family nuclease